MTTSEPLFLSAEQAGEVVGVPAATIRNLRRYGRLKGVVVGRHLRFARAEIERFAKELMNDDKR